MAQTLVFHLSDGTTTGIELSSSFRMYNENGKTIVCLADGSTKQFTQSDILTVTYHETKGDVNRDNAVDVADIATIIDIMAENGQNDSILPPATAIAVDLGLPSGTKWANINVGAEQPEDYGQYFAWGETDEKDYYWDDTYNFLNEDLGDISGTQYDVAHIKWGGKWYMPNNDDYQELLDNCTSEWTTLNGIYCRKFTSTINGNIIYLPASNARWYDGFYNYGANHGYYWSSTQYTNSMAYHLIIDITGSILAEWGYRQVGHSVRPVFKE